MKHRLKLGIFACVLLAVASCSHTILPEEQNTLEGEAGTVMQRSPSVHILWDRAVNPDNLRFKNIEMYHWVPFNRNDGSNVWLAQATVSDDRELAGSTTFHEDARKNTRFDYHHRQDTIPVSSFLQIVILASDYETSEGNG